MNNISLLYIALIYLAVIRSRALLACYQRDARRRRSPSGVSLKLLCWAWQSLVAASEHGWA